MAASASDRAGVTPVQRFAQVFGAHLLHLATAALALYFGMAGRRAVAPTA